VEENLGPTLLCTSMCELSQGLNIGVENKGLQLSAFRSHPEELQLWILESLQPWFEWHGKRVALTTIGTQDCEISSVSQLQHSWSRRMDFACGFETSSSMHPVSCSVPTCYMFPQANEEGDWPRARTHHAKRWLLDAWSRIQPSKSNRFRLGTFWPLIKPVQDYICYCKFLMFPGCTLFSNIQQTFCKSRSQGPFEFMVIVSLI
jgi:hypothetical protein